MTKRLLRFLCLALALLGVCSAASAAYDLQIDAPPRISALLERHLDLARFRTEPDTTSAEVARLAQLAPAQVRDLLATEGYFNPVVEVRMASDAVVSVTVNIQPGPRAAVGAVSIKLTGTAANLPDADALQARLNAAWALPRTSAFSQTGWDDAKSALLNLLWIDRYPLASLTQSEALVDADKNSVALTLNVDSGPVFYFGDLRVTGLVAVPDSVISNVAAVQRGAAYKQQALVDLQERLQATGLFESVSVGIDPDPATAAAAPVLVTVRELQRHKLVLGLGYSANTGQRVSVDHLDHRVFGLPWQAKTSLMLAREERSIGTELTSYIQPGRYRNLLAAQVSRTQTDGYPVLTQRLRAGRTQDGERIERLYYLELDRSVANTAIGSLDGSALTANYQWVWRDVDSVVFPTQGQSLSAQVGAGLRFDGARSGQPFARALARATLYRHLGERWLGQARLELGYVAANSSAGIPQALLFRAGGDDSVRGYDYQALGVNQSGVIIGGRFLATASLEAAVPVLPEWLAAVFVDVGDASDTPHAWQANVGVGIGARWRSPVGPLRIDLARGVQAKRTKLHVSLGMVF